VVKIGDRCVDVGIGDGNPSPPRFRLDEKFVDQPRRDCSLQLEMRLDRLHAGRTLRDRVGVERVEALARDFCAVNSRNPSRLRRHPIHARCLREGERRQHRHRQRWTHLAEARALNHC
jgi:hypothetical protein